MNLHWCGEIDPIVLLHQLPFSLFSSSAETLQRLILHWTLRAGSREFAISQVNIGCLPLLLVHKQRLTSPTLFWEKMRIMGQKVG